MALSSGLKPGIDPQAADLAVSESSYILWWPRNGDIALFGPTVPIFTFSIKDTIGSL